MPYDAAARAIAREYLREVRAVTICDRCGCQPVDFHREEHLLRPNERVAHLAALGFPVERIAAEIALCEPVCRSCHMKEDGRSKRLTEARPRKAGMVFVGPVPCALCSRPTKPTRRGMCRQCYDATWRPKRLTPSQ